MSTLFYNPKTKIARPANSGGHVDGAKAITPIKTSGRGAHNTVKPSKCSVIAREQHQWQRGAVIVRQQAVVGGQLNLFGGN